MQIRSLGQEDPWRRKWQPLWCFRLENPHEQRGLAVYSPQDCKQLDMTEATQHTNTDNSLIQQALLEHLIYTRAHLSAGGQSHSQGKRCPCPHLPSTPESRMLHMSGRGIQLPVSSVPLGFRFHRVNRSLPGKNRMHKSMTFCSHVSYLRKCKLRFKDKNRAKVAQTPFMECFKIP